MPRIKARLVGIASLDGSNVGGDAWLYPHFCVTPLVFTHALYKCQRNHERAIDRVPLLQPLRRLRDRAPIPPSVGTLCSHVQYVDNFFSLGSAETVVGTAVDFADPALGELGLP